MPHPTYPLEMLPLTKIRGNPLNPRKNFSGKKFDDMVASVEKKGVIQPIIVRKKPDAKTKTDYELVAGHRRHKAKTIAAERNGGIAGAVIPAIIRDLSDDEAFEFLTIENLQREDLTELEEAESFKSYLDRKGDAALLGLAEKVGVHPGYIRRRVKVLELPAKLLKAWDTGKVSYGHLEQLLRIRENKALLKEYCNDLLEDVHWKRPPTVSELKKNIDGESPLLTNAVFPTEKCAKCSKNSDVQKKLFDIDSEKSKCLDKNCFANKTYQHILKKTGPPALKRNKTADWVMINAPSKKGHFVESWKYHSFDRGDKPKTKCADCKDFVTIFGTDGSIKHAKGCIGSDNCFYAKETKTGGSKKKAKDTDGPRVSWHGGHFRDDFFQTVLPLKIEACDDADEKALRSTLYAMLISNDCLFETFAAAIGQEKKDITTHGGYLLDRKKAFAALKALDIPKMQNILKTCAARVVLEGCNEDREIIATHLGADIKTEFSVTEEYLNKKTKDELISFGEKYGIFEDPKAQDFLYTKLLKKRGKFTTCKKTELVRVFTESGVDLVGKVPDEILNPQ